MSSSWLSEQLQKQREDLARLYDDLVNSSRLPVYMIVDRGNNQPRDRFHLLNVGDNKYKRYFLDFEYSHKVEWDLSWHSDSIAEFFSYGWWIPVEPISHKDFLLLWKMPSPRMSIPQSQ